jgi:hypothetical protein
MKPSQEMTSSTRFANNSGVMDILKVVNLTQSLPPGAPK